MRSRAGSSRTRRLAHAFLAPLAVALLLLTSQATAATAAVSLPKDESPHPSAATEWWYFNGHLTGLDPSGKVHRYGFLLSFIRTNQLNTEPAAALYNGQLAITDLTRGTFTADMSEFAVEPDVVPSGGGFDNSVGA